MDSATYFLHKGHPWMAWIHRWPRTHSSVLVDDSRTRLFITNPTRLVTVPVPYSTVSLAVRLIKLPFHPVTKAPDLGFYFFLP